MAETDRLRETATGTGNDPFSRWLSLHPEASRRDSWDAAVGAAMEMLNTLCVDKCGDDPVRVLSKLSTLRGGKGKP